MSIQDQRNEIIKVFIPVLIKQLTGFKDDDPNMQKCQHFAWSIIKNHHNLSTNSHEVRRRIEGIQERLRVENFAEYAEYLGRLCELIIQHPLCVNHYELDIHWSLLDFLFTIAYNPTAALKHNKNTITIKPLPVDDVVVKNEENAKYWANILKEDHIDIKIYSDDNSDLSEWSDDEKTLNINDSDKSGSIKANTNSFKCSDPLFENIKPPQKSYPFIEFNGCSNVKELLEDQVQHSWWLTESNDQCQAPVESKYMEANFSVLYSHFISETSNNLIPHSTPSTISELNLLREILWMFHEPNKCAMFTIDEKFNIRKRRNYSIPSVTVDGLTKFLEKQFLPYIRMMYTLRNFHKLIYNDAEGLPPKTIECYGANLHIHLKPIWDDLLAYEHRLRVQKDFDINTLINMRRTLDEAFNRLQCLYEIHKNVYIDHTEYPAHICSAYLLARLRYSYQNEHQPMKANLSMSLLIAAIKVFCDIIDTWWLEGRLDDWQDEYIVERINKLDQAVCVREYDRVKGKTFFIPAHVSDTILKDTLFQLMREHSLEAGHTLNVLYEINRISDLRNNCLLIEDKLYNIFIKDFLSHVEVFGKTIVANAENAEDEREEEKTEANEEMNKNDIENSNNNENVCLTADASTNIPDENDINSQSILNDLTTKDQLLLMALGLSTSSPNVEDQLEQNIKAVPNALDIFEQLQQCSSIVECILPLEEIFIQTLSQILDKRITFANSFVMSLYRNEFMILKHLKHIRQVLLLEASDVMHQFYTKLFTQIEYGDTWTNASLLTMQLDDVICAKYPEMSSLFRVDIDSSYRCQTKKVYEVVDELIISYNMKRELTQVISLDDIKAYNKIFRFLLKIKWGLITLEELSFPHSRKRRPPFAEFQMIDLIMRRLEQLRFWMIFAIQSVHFHLMTHVLQSLGEQLEIKIKKCEDLKEMEMVHKSYLSTACEHCFLVDNLSTIKLGVEQFLGLTYIVRLEWLACVAHLENSGPLSVDISETSSYSPEFSTPDYVTNTQIDAIELTYIRCHQYLANQLNNEVYLKKRHFLTGLSAAFNTSTPY